MTDIVNTYLPVVKGGRTLYLYVDENGEILKENGQIIYFCSDYGEYIRI